MFRVAHAVYCSIWKDSQSKDMFVNMCNGCNCALWHDGVRDCRSGIEPQALT